MAFSSEQNEILQALAAMIKQSAGVREPIVGVEARAEKENAEANKKLLEANKQLIAALKKYKNVTELSNDQFDEIAKAADKAGVKLDDLIDATTLTVKSFDDLQEETDELAAAMDKTTDKTKKHTKTVQTAINIWDQHSQKIKDSFGLFVEENRIMKERAANDATYADAVIGLGISMKEWSTILADNRGVQQAMASSGRDFTEELSAGSERMRSFSKDNVQAAKTTAALMKGIAGFGVSQKNLDGALNEQINMYEKNYRVFGITAEAFAESTAALVTDTDIRNNLSIMGEKERKAFIVGLQAREAERLAMGYTAEQARELTKTFAALAGETPKERMKKAAKQRALAGALGMGEEGARLQQLMVNINQLQGKERTAALKEIEDIQRGMANALQVKKGQGIASEMFATAFADKAGFLELARTLETRSKEGQKIDKAQMAATAAGREVPWLIDKGLTVLSWIEGYQATSVALLGTIAFALTKGKILSLISNVFKGGGGKAAAAGAGKLASMAGGAKSVLGSVVAKVAAPLAGVIAGYEKYAELKDKKELTAGQKTAQIGTTAVGGTGGALAGAAAGAAIGTLAGPIGTIVGGLIGGAVGAWGGSEAGASIGEGISDLMAKPETQQAAKEKIAAEPAVTTEISKKTTDNDSLVATLKELMKYIKTINEQNSEQAAAMRALAEVIKDNKRFAVNNRSRV